MTKEEQILAGIEEIAIQLKDLKKTAENPIKKTDTESGDLITNQNKIDSLVQESNKTSARYDYYFNEIIQFQRDSKSQNTLKQNEVVHKYIEVKNATRWLWSIVSAGVVCIIVIFILASILKKRNEQLTISKANDLKYRFMKVQSESLLDLKKVAANSTELVYYFDALYKDNPIKFESYVTNREEQIRIAFEASEIAKQKEADAKSAREKANVLNNKIK